ncbi:coiled-coil domain-containing protein 73-like [Sinocyclocheilus grahami]|uniref:coiled-coil domain-containing protein 73-like n=1 Tax=Sinocyclocheilus grahami TaxID=75366 RepID=UPI0007AD123B|nr:PREDICTED: coiled-coil domain-containing protein 73-like [Sinocyclocheilus grahami]
MSNENSESLAAVKKQFQAQIRKVEGEKGKNQLAAELKDKEIISLKEELKQLQLLRYSSEKKLGELEQKLQLQTQTKDSHLNQLGEVERRFAVISRQCAMVKQAHDKLEQNVEEAMRMNKKLTSINKGLQTLRCSIYSRSALAEKNNCYYLYGRMGIFLLEGRTMCF